MLVDDYAGEWHGLTRFLIEKSLVDQFESPARRDVGQGLIELKSSYWDRVPQFTGNDSYAVTHESLAAARCYDLRFLDGALLQAHYEFFARGSGEVRRYAVNFLPSPDLLPFQTDPDLYLDDELYGNVVDLRAVTVPLRFDYDSRAEVVVDLHHPVSHLTIGAYKQCRIPVSGPLSPHSILEFILRSFYRTKNRHWTDELPARKVAKPPSTITLLERSYVHVGAPTV